jgi:hypothetical protein
VILLRLCRKAPATHKILFILPIECSCLRRLAKKTPESLSSSAHAGELANIKLKIKLLEAQLGEEPARLGDVVFSSKDDVAVFVEEHASGLSFALFNDSITLLESITEVYIERKDVLTEYYQAGHVGLSEPEAKHVSSFKLILPSIFGLIKEGDKESEKSPLNAVRDFKSWNPQNNVGGVKRKIEKGLDDLRLQIPESVKDACYLLPKAERLALQMHDRSQAFLVDMCNWIDSFYLELKTTSQCSPEEAWHLVALWVKMVFEELRLPRAKAANAAELTTPNAKLTAFLWAMCQTHQVMNTFLSHRFRGHPAIAPVVLLHIFTTRVTTRAHDEVLTSLTKISKRVDFMDKLNDRLTKLEKKG